MGRAVVAGALTLFAIGIATPARAQAPADPCLGVDCSGAGTCFAERGRALCLCDPGYAAVDLLCFPLGEGDDVGRARHRPGVADRIVEVGLGETNARLYGVGHDLGEYPFALSSYLQANEWWCADFVAWVYRVAGMPLTGGYEGGWLIPNNEALVAWFAREGAWVANGSSAWRTFEPRPGDFVRFETGRGGHAAIITEVHGDTLYTIEGNVDGRVRRGRHLRFRDDSRIDGVGLATLPNAPPVVEAAELVEIAWPTPVTLSAIVADDGPPQDVVVSWDFDRGPGEVAFDAPIGADTEVSFSEPGIYVLTVTAADGEHVTTAQVTVDAWEPAQPIYTAASGEPRAVTCAAAPSSQGPGAAPIWLAAIALVVTASSRRALRRP